MRSRNLKPGFFSNEHLVALGSDAMLLFAGLWCLADREGKLEDRPMRIRAAIFPYTPAIDVDVLLQKLERSRFIFRYSTRPAPDQHRSSTMFDLCENCFILIPKFLEHQNPHVKEKTSLIPNPVLEQCNTGTSTSLAGLIPDSPSLIPDSPSLIPDSPSLIPDSIPSAEAARDSQFTQPLEEVLDETAKRIKKRHPSGRACSETIVRSKLKTIVKKIPGVPAKVAKLRRIDENHRGWCASENWTKEECQYAKGLENWLAPSMGRFDEEPPSANGNIGHRTPIFETRPTDRNPPR